MATREEQIKAHDLATKLAPYAWNDFAKSLVEFFNKNDFLTPKQIAAGENLVRKAKEGDWSASDEPLKVMPLVGQQEPEAPTYNPHEEPF